MWEHNNGDPYVLDVGVLTEAMKNIDPTKERTATFVHDSKNNIRFELEFSRMTHIRVYSMDEWLNILQGEGKIGAHRRLIRSVMEYHQVNPVRADIVFDKETLTPRQVDLYFLRMVNAVHWLPSVSVWTKDKWEYAPA